VWKSGNFDVRLVAFLARNVSEFFTGFPPSEMFSQSRRYNGQLCHRPSLSLLSLYALKTMAELAIETSALAEHLTWWESHEEFTHSGKFVHLANKLRIKFRSTSFSLYGDN
jgi:hypothetical protein